MAIPHQEEKRKIEIEVKAWCTINAMFKEKYKLIEALKRSLTLKIIANITCLKRLKIKNRMIRILTAMLALLFSINLLGQNFEGKVIYQSTYISKLPNVTDQQWNTMLGTTQEYFIKGGNYKSVMNGTFAQWQLYLHADNRLYNKISGSEAVLWNDASLNPDEVLRAEMRKNATEIAGFRCDELVLTCKSGVQKYYFNGALVVDTALFAHHRYGNWSAYVSRAKALPLKLVIENSQFTLESLAVEIKAMPLDNSLFALPAGTTLPKSPY